LHNEKIIHRNINPLNILFDKNNIIKIGDFGDFKKLADETITKISLFT
jgi:serine/threonine-protein kinase